MKKVLVLVSLLTLGFTSCSKDDDSSSGSTGIEGKWAHFKQGAIVGGNEVLMNYEHECATKKDYIQLMSGGTANDVYYPADCTAETSTGTWSKTGNNVTLTVDGVSATAEILTLDATTLKVKINDSGTEMIEVFKRQ